MERLTAPQWIRDREQSYRNAGRQWSAAQYLWLLCLVLWLGTFRIDGMAVRAWLGCAILLSWVALVVLEPGKRARRCRTAAHALQTAIAGYESSPDQPDSALRDADRRVREVQHTERLRTAPVWIRRQRYRCQLKISAWMSPVIVVVMALPSAGVFWRWNWDRPWNNGFCVAALVFVLLALAAQKTRPLMKARDILNEAIERYEYESGATENTLRAAERQAAGVSPG